MLMPIVSMNKMAMNESVATTCCYRQVATPTATYWEVLNGGWIGSGYVEELVKKSPYGSMDSSWFDFKYDIVGDGVGDKLKNNFVKYVSGATVGTDTSNPSGNWLVYGVDVTNPSGDTLSGFLANMGLRTDATCDHKTNVNCVYRETKIAFKDNQHFESKTKHDKGGSDWAKPHGAAQFSS